MFRRQRGMVGTPPSARQVPADAADHAEDFAHRWVDRLENVVEGRMHALDLRIGSSDNEGGTFFPHERYGGVATGGRVDSGVLNPDLLTSDYGEEAGKLWKKSRSRDRVDAIIAHELAEGDAGTHEEALRLGARTTLPITKESRQILEAMERGWNR